MKPGSFNVEFADLRHYPKYGYAILMAVVVYVDLQGHKHVACIGMPTDGLTIPRFFWRLAGAPFKNKRLLAAIIHDHYCYKARTLPIGKMRNALRKSGDCLFREMCKVLGDNKAQAAIYYAAVRTGAAANALTPTIPDYIHDYEAFMQWRNKPLITIPRPLSSLPA